MIDFDVTMIDFGVTMIDFDVTMILLKGRHVVVTGTCL